VTRELSSVSLVDPDQITPRPLFCITRDVHNDWSLAEDVCEGRFTHAGITLELGTTPDWLGADLPPDDEWRIEWSKFYYGLDLANAFCANGEIRFLRTWERLVQSWTQQVAPGLDASDVAARRMQNWTYAWSLFASAPRFPGLRDGLDEKILSSLADHAAYIRARLTPDVYRNHRTLELYALFIVALAFPRIDPSSELLRFTIAELYRSLTEGFHPDGVHRENSTHYHLVVLRSLLGMRENARRFALEIPDDFDAHLEKACEFALHCHRPDGLVSALSDADSVAYPEVLRLAASLLDRPDFRYAATEGTQGTAPIRRYVSFPTSGYFVQRSGWGTDGSDYRDERYLIFDCGPLGEGGHGHYDLLSIEMYAHGRALLVDPGRYTYSEEEPNLRHWFKGTAAHNTVCIDGTDQTPYRRGKPGKRVAVGRFGGRWSAPGFDVLEGRTESPCYDAVHTRRIFFVGDEYWIVEDRLEAGREHRYDLRWHLSVEAWEAAELLETEQGHLVRAPGLALVFAGSDTAQLEPGWVSPKYGVKNPAPVVNIGARGKNVRWLTLLAPLRGTGSAPRLDLREVGSDPSGTTIVSVEGIGAIEDARDRVAWTTTGRADFQLGTFLCTARAAWLRESAEGNPTSFRGLGVTDIASIEDRRIFAGVRPNGWVAWDAGKPVASSREAQL
jgi:hypothetical protein